MSTEDNKELVRRALEVVNTHNLNEFEQYFAPDSKFYGFVPQTLGLEGYKQTLVVAFAAFPEWRLTIDDMIAEGDKVVTRCTIRGTHQGAFQGIPPTGKPFTAQGITIARLVNGKAAELWNAFDNLGLLQQLGVIPAPAQAS